MPFSVTSLNVEHCFSINMVVFKQSRAKTDSLVGFGVQEIGKLSWSDCQVIFAAADSDFAFLWLVERRSFALDHVFILEDSDSVDGSLTSEKADSDLTIAFLESCSIYRYFGFSSKRPYFRLDGLNGVGGTSNRSNRNHPHIVKPLIGPSSKDVEFLFISIIESASRLPCQRLYFLIFLKLNGDPVEVVYV